MLDFLSAIGLIFILEGLLLFSSPKRLKEILQIITIYPESKIRIMIESDDEVTATKYAKDIEKILKN